MGSKTRSTGWKIRESWHTILILTVNLIQELSSNYGSLKAQCSVWIIVMFPIFKVFNCSQSFDLVEIPLGLFDCYIIFSSQHESSNIAKMGVLTPIHFILALVRNFGSRAPGKIPQSILSLEVAKKYLILNINHDDRAYTDYCFSYFEKYLSLILYLYS